MDNAKGLVGTMYDIVPARGEGTVNVIVENPATSRLKIEMTEAGFFMLDRIHQTHLGSPTAYGLIPKTLDEDDGALDILLVIDQDVPTGLVIECRVIGVMYMNDTGEVDNKIIVVAKADKSKEHIKSVDDLGEQFKKATTHYFEHYKDLKGDKVIIEGWGDVEAANRVVDECVARYESSKG
jgi:inorganic pyrophosphatase